MPIASSPMGLDSINPNNAYNLKEVDGSTGIRDFFSGESTAAHNEAVMSWMRETASAREAREYERWLADTQMQRKVQDFEKAGFSPLAALEASQGNYAPAVQSASSSAASAGSGPGALLPVLVMALAAIATKGISAASAANTAKTAAAAKDAAQMNGVLAKFLSQSNVSAGDKWRTFLKHKF